ncbi:pyruvate ferredoxin oxidoreductase [Metallosphaera tengchongensis]|uniref:Pyruvate ferredoxin oxidoreductase n=1 Tax=Metallosphaera tengchongensis TaxID=1532350 RepID=A0A6N0NU04_9CREN|nr:2-oxoacid:acceptor oxidoreductase family protein [Metallosphaera tengchongensis]QKQ99258.1 pyruvate ferredoxin oxidoreductase [Metallosphaera tengchongensis]
MDRLNILIAGIGGQGVVTAGKILAEAFHEKGLTVFESETHGLSQRGGAVTTHVRVGNVNVPLIPKGGADILIAMDGIEALRNASYLSTDAKVFLNESVKLPSLPNVKPVSISYVLENLRPWRTYTLDCEQIVRDGYRCNTVILGLVYEISLRKYLDINDFIKVLRGPTNVKSFMLGVQRGKYYESLAAMDRLV